MTFFPLKLSTFTSYNLHSTSKCHVGNDLHIVNTRYRHFSLSQRKRKLSRSGRGREEFNPITPPSFEQKLSVSGTCACRKLNGLICLVIAKEILSFSLFRILERKLLSLECSSIMTMISDLSRCGNQIKRKALISLFAHNFSDFFLLFSGTSSVFVETSQNICCPSGREKNVNEKTTLKAMSGNSHQKSKRCFERVGFMISTFFVFLVPSILAFSVFSVRLTLGRKKSASEE